MTSIDWQSHLDSTPTTSVGDELKLRCPVCNRSSLYINVVTRLYVCHRATCSLSGGMLPLGVLKGCKENTVALKPRPALPLKNISGESFNTVLSYPVIDTGYRLAMQVRDFNGQLRGYVLRSETMRPKALTYTGDYCGLHFPYLSSRCTELVLVEDIPSAELLAPYIPAVALLGSALTSNQVDYLLEHGVHRVVFCLDDDATHKAVKQARTLRTLLNASAVACSPDPKDMAHEQLTELSRRLYAQLYNP